MPALLIKDLPADVYRWLEREAALNRRSMAQQAVVLLRERMLGFKPVHFGTPLKTRTPLTAEFIEKAKTEGRS